MYAGFPKELIFRRDIPAGQMARDMSLFADDDGTAFHVYASEENGTLQISQQTADYLRPAGRYIRVFAELVENRSFEYSNADHDRWHSLISWELVPQAGSSGTVSIENREPVHTNNPSYALLTAEGSAGVGLRNFGFAGIPLKTGKSIRFPCSL